jgi:tetratricopeptide (TPR) repeat protein
VTPRARVLSLTALAAGVAVAVVLAVALGQRGPTGQAPDPSASLPKGAPPLALDLGLRADPEAVALRRAAGLYDRSVGLDETEPEAARRLRAQAGAIFARYTSLDARLGKAFAAWPTGTEDAVERLAGLHGRSAVVQLHLGIARLWVGRAGSEDALHTAVELAPDTQVAVTAGNLLFPDYLRDLPRFVPVEQLSGGIDELSAPAQVETLRARWRKGDRVGGLYYGIALQRLGRTLSARRVFADVARRHPGDVEAQVADAVGRFDKENPAAAFSRLGPLSRTFPKAATVRFHLGLLLVWSKQLKPAVKQFRQAIALEPGSVLATQAQRYVDALGRAG